MSLWKKIKKAAKKVAKAASTVVNTVTQAAADVVESSGNAIESGLNALGALADKVPDIGGPIGDSLRYLGRVTAGATDVASAAITTSGGLLGATISAGIQIGVGGIIWDGSLIKDGFLEMTSGLVSGILLFGAKTIAAFSALLPGTEQRVPLTAAQKKLVQRVFHDSIAVENVRLVKSKYGSGLLVFGDRPFTLGNVIYLKGRNVDDEPELLVHECTHVWQYQNQGSTYIADAVGAQQLVPDAYSWEREVARGNDQWPQFNAEAQAAFLEDIYTDGQLLTYSVTPSSAPGPVGKPHSHAAPAGTFAPLLAAVVATSPKGGGVFYDADGFTKVGYFEFGDPLVDHTQRANRAVEVVRNATNLRPSGAFD